VPLGERHYHHVLKRIEHHHNRQRPHQGWDNVPQLGLDYPDHPAPLARCAVTQLWVDC
jgi:hypothetical protein